MGFKFHQISINFSHTSPNWAPIRIPLIHIISLALYFVDRLTHKDSSKNKLWNWRFLDFARNRYSTKYDEKQPNMLRWNITILMLKSFDDYWSTFLSLSYWLQICPKAYQKHMSRPWSKISFLHAFTIHCIFIRIGVEGRNKVDFLSFNVESLWQSFCSIVISLHGIVSQNV